MLGFYSFLVFIYCSLNGFAFGIFASSLLLGFFVSGSALAFSCLQLLHKYLDSIQIAFHLRNFAVLLPSSFFIFLFFCLFVYLLCYFASASTFTSTSGRALCRTIGNKSCQFVFQLNLNVFVGTWLLLLLLLRFPWVLYSLPPGLGLSSSFS